MSTTESTLILIKPDGVRRALIGEVIRRIERKGLSIDEMQLRTLDAQTAEAHYGEHRERPFFGELVEFITGGPLVALVVSGPGAVTAMRQLAGATNPIEAHAGSIRGEFATEIGENIIHGSDSPESATREIALFFPVR